MIDTNKIDQRRRELGMSFPVLARRSGVSLAAVRRAFSRGVEHAKFQNVIAISNALGMRLELVADTTAQEMREALAVSRAKKIVSMVQGTMGLEGQSVSESVKDEMVVQTVHELMARPKRSFWEGE